MRKQISKGLPPSVRRKKAKGRVYYYFDTGQRDDGKPILARLPDIADRDFGRAYAAALASKSKRASPLPLLTVPGLIAMYEKSPEFRKKALSTRKTYGTYLALIESKFAEAPAEQVERRDVLRLLDTMGDRTGAANMVLAVFGALYSWGRRRQHVSIKPTDEIDAFESQDYEPWPEWLVEAALESDDALIRLGTALLYFTAQRIGDVCAMRWSDVRDGVIYIRQQKTGTEMEIPVHDRLAALLPRPAAITILHHGGQRYTPPRLRIRLQQWAAKHGVKVVAHGLRKNAVNALLEAGCSVGETSAISGQSLQIVEHYAKRRNRGKMASAAILKWQENKA